MVVVGRIGKGTKGPTHWELISQDIQTKLGTMRSEEECRRRYDTLLKAYKKVKKTGKQFCDITDAERREVNLATPLSEEWYKAIDRICLQRGSNNVKSRKRAKVNPEPEKPTRKQVAIPGFRALSDDLRSTLLYLIQASSMEHLWRTSCKLEVVCRWLAIVQDRKPSDIRRRIFELSELKLVIFKVAEGAPCVQPSNLRVYKKFVHKVLRKNRDLDIYLHIRDDYGSVTFPKAPLSLAVQRIRVLSLYECEGLEHADLSYFPQLRCLDIEDCHSLKAVTGWEVVKELGWLEIRGCPFYKDFPSVHFLPSLREFLVTDNVYALQVISVPDFSQCVRLRRLEIVGYNFSALNSVDLSTLRFLEVLSFEGCSALTTIQDLSGLHSLTKLDLSGCEALRRVPELGCLKALTHLDMSRSGVEEISGVQELHLLIELHLYGSCH